MLKLIPLVLVLGCGIVAGPPPADPTRASLDSQHVAWTTVAVVGGALTATCGAAVPIVDKFVTDEDDANVGNLVLGLCSVVGGGMTLLGTTMAGQAVQDWSAMGGGTP